MYLFIKEFIGPKEEIEYFGNNVLYGIGGEKVDFLCLHNKTGIRYKATVIELKKDGIDMRGIEQIEDYPYWVAQLATANLQDPITNFEIQPILIGHHTRKEIIETIKNMSPKSIGLPYRKRCEVLVKKPILIEYKVEQGNISFSC